MRCHECGELFSLFRWQRQCSCCQQQVCAQCSPDKKFIPRLGLLTFVRVCKSCSIKVPIPEGFRLGVDGICEHYLWNNASTCHHSINIINNNNNNSCCKPEDVQDHPVDPPKCHKDFTSLLDVDEIQVICQHVPLAQLPLFMSVNKLLLMIGLNVLSLWNAPLPLQGIVNPFLLVEKVGVSKDIPSICARRCPKVDDLVLMAAIQNSFSALKNIDVGGCYMVSDLALLVISKCKNLQKLNLSCTPVTDVGVTFVLKECPVLEELDVSLCKNITDQSLIAAVECAKNLQILIASGCPNLSSDVLDKMILADQFIGLRILDLGGVRDVSVQQKRSFQRAYPKCAVFITLRYDQ